MAKRRASTKKSATGGRGSAEAIEKRRAARQLNALFSGEKRGKALDGRTEKRRLRLMKELKEGKRKGKALKAIEIVVATNELLELGESISSLRKAGIKPQKAHLADDDLDVVKRTHEAYGFRPEAWKMLGIDAKVLAGEKAAKKVAKKTTKKKTRRKRS